MQPAAIMNSRARVCLLPDRGVLRVAGAGAEKLLQGLVTNDLGLLAGQAAIHAGLLSPQGKILFEFFIVKSDAKADGTLLLDVARDPGPGLAKRLTMYKLRADVTITDVSDQFVVLALWGENASSPGETNGTVSFADPRHRDMGLRILADAKFATDIASATNGFDASPQDYAAHRIALGVPEGGRDFDFGDAYPHEANFDLMGGVSFTKGCYVGQEIVARMQHKTVIRKRVVPISGLEALPSDRPDITANGLSIGKLGSVAGNAGLAMLRLDRAAEFTDKGVALMAGAVLVTLAPTPWLATLDADPAPGE